MPIDPSIPLRAVQPRTRQRDPMRDYANMLQVSELQDQRAKRNAFEQAAQGAIGPDGTVDYDMLKSAYATTGNPEGALKIDSMLSQRKKSELDAQTAQYKQFKQRLDLTGRIVAGVNDQASWDRARASFSRFGLNGDALPEQYDPAVVDQLRNEALTASQQLDQMWKQKEFGLSERRTAASERTADAAAAGKMGTRIGDTRVGMNPDTVANSEAKKYGEYLINNEYKRVDEEAAGAEAALQNLSMMEGIDVTSGAAEPFKAWVSGLAEGLGFDPAKVGLESASNAQAYTGIAQRMVLTAMQAQKGPQTENDAKRIERTVASLGNTPDAKQFLNNAAIAVESTKVEKRDFYQRWVDEKGSFKGAAKAWNDYRKTIPFLINNPKTGRPMFFHEFQRLNQGKSKDELLEAWRAAGG